jgi:archaellum component FlaC
MGNIEGLKKEVDEIKNSLNALKNNVSISDPEKKSQIESIKSQAEIVKEKIQKEISSLENKGDDISKQAKEKAQALLGSFDKITSLYNSITNTPKNEPSIQPQQPETESKDIFSKAKDWI